MSDKYYVISTSEDGDVSLTCYATREGVLTHLNLDGGEGEPVIDPRKCCGDSFLPAYDLAGESRTFIIKGEIVVPKPKQTVIEYELP